MATKILSKSFSFSYADSSQNVSVLNSLKSSSGYSPSEVAVDQNNKQFISIAPYAFINTSFDGGAGFNTEIVSIKLEFKAKTTATSSDAKFCFWLGRDSGLTNSANSVYVTNRDELSYYNTLSGWTDSNYTTWTLDFDYYTTSLTPRVVVLYSNTDRSGLQFTSEDFSFGGKGLIIGIGTTNLSGTTAATLTMSNLKLIVDYKSEVGENYTIQFNGNGNTGGDLPLDFTQGGTSTSVIMGNIPDNIPIKTGYVFRGWSSTPSYNQNYRIAYWENGYGGDADSNGVSATTTGSNWTYQDYCTNTGYTGTSTTLVLYAQWEASVTNYTVTFDDNGGTGGPGSITFPSGEGVKIPDTTPTRNGYTFRGWEYSSAGETVRLNPGDIISPKTSITLYAVWESNITNYTITYNANGGFNAPSSETTTGSYTISTTQPTRTKYSFLGWSTNSSATSPSYYPEDSLTVSSSMTLYAVWQSAIKIELGRTNTATINFAYQQIWFYFIPSISSSYIIESSNSSGDPYVVLYDGSGTQLAYNDDSSDNGNNFKLTYTLNAGIKYYIKVHHYSTNNSTSNITFNITTNSYTITYNANGGSVSPTSQTVTVGTETITPIAERDKGVTSRTINFHANGGTISKSNQTSSATITYGSDGWYTKANGGTYRTSNGGSYIPTQSETLYNHWYIASTGTYSSITFPTGERTGYKLIGFSTNSSADPNNFTGYKPGQNVVVSETNYYAIWKPNSYQFTLGKAEHVNTDESTSSGTKNYGDTIILRATVDTGYSFGQWTSSNTSLIDNQTSANTSFPMPAGNITMTPSVTSNQYKIIYDIETNANPGNSLYSQPSDTIYSYTGRSINITSTEPIQTGGYTFVGWCRTSNSTSDILKPGDSINQSTSDITLYAVWEKNIEITYDINGGSGSTPTKQSTTIYNKNGATFSLASNTGFSREGYEFDGWSTTLNDSSTQVLSDTIFKESATLYALWDIQYYSLTTKIYTNGVESNEGGNSVSISDIESGSSDGNTYAYGSVVKLIATAVDPYDFESWSQDGVDKGPGAISDKGNKSIQTFTITKDTVIRANFATGTISACFYCYDITSGQPVLTTSTVKLWIRSKAATELTYDEKVWEQKSFSTKMTYNVPTHIQVLIENGEEYEFNSGTGINFDYEIPDQLTDILIKSEQSFSIPCKKLKEENHIYVNNVLKKSGHIRDPYFSQYEPISSIWIGNKQIMGLSPSEVYPYTEDSLLIDTLYVNNTGDFLEKSYQGYTSIKKIIIPKNIKTIGANYLSGCINLKTVKFLRNSELTSLGNWAFAEDSSLLKIYLPDKLQNIGKGAFQNCAALQKIVLPASISTIQQSAFYKCSSLQSLKLNHTKITELPDSVFSSCSNLKRVFLPKTLTSIGSNAFQDCNSLEKIIYMGTIEDWNKITISTDSTDSDSATIIQCIDGITYTNLK